MAYIRTLPSGKYRVEIRKNHITIQNKTFVDKSEAELWAADFDSKIEVIFSPRKLKKTTPGQVKEFGGIALFQKLGMQTDFLAFKTLVNEYTLQWDGKDENMLRRAEFWLNVFDDKPVKSIKANHMPLVQLMVMVPRS